MANQPIIEKHTSRSTSIKQGTASQTREYSLRGYADEDAALSALTAMAFESNKATAVESGEVWQGEQRRSHHRLVVRPKANRGGIDGDIRTGKASS